MSAAEALTALRRGGKGALSRALSAMERAPDDPKISELLDLSFAEGQGKTVGVTGPPGVGKSTLLDQLVTAWRARGVRVGVIAVDPSSARTGGALLGDRARLASVDPSDDGVFFRSMASRGRLGGLAEMVYPAATLMRALYDIVIIETVGVGQSEIEVSALADITMLCVQPASGDTLQFLKAGIMEVPDIIVVTKADLGAVAERARSEIAAALSVTDASASQPSVEALAVSATTKMGVSDLLEAVESRFKTTFGGAAMTQLRDDQGRAWLTAAIRARFGDHGVNTLEAHGKIEKSGRIAPFGRLSKLSNEIGTQFAALDFD